MNDSVRAKGVEGGGGIPGRVLDAPDQGALFDPPELRPEEFVKRLLRLYDVKKTVALAYYPPIDKKTKRELRGPDLERHVENAVGNVDRMLEGHNPLTVRLLDCVRRVVPGAGVAIAHFWADRGGTERGSPKLDMVRMQDEVLAIRANFERADTERDIAMSRLKVLQDYIERERRENR
jgi:hypothetical protein